MNRIGKLEIDSLSDNGSISNQCEKDLLLIRSVGIAGLPY